MLNYAETTGISTIVPVTPPSQSQCQEHAPDSLLSMLSTLFAHPEFVQGVRDCQEYYFDLYDEVPLTEEEMFKAVEINLSRRTAKVDQQTTAILGGEAPSYLEKLGWVIGTIAKGLTYAEAQHSAVC
jgi:hypothetical protein